MLVWTFLRCKEYSRCYTSPRFDSIFSKNECVLHSGVDHIYSNFLNMLWSNVVYFSVWVQEIVPDSFWISIRFFYVADKNIKIFCSFSLSLSSIMQTIHKKKRKKIFYRIKLDKAQISRKKWTHTLDNAMSHFCLI